MTSALILASTSPYRRELLSRLGLAFDCLSPAVDEALREGEAPAERAMRLARAKALAGASERPGAWVIGSDQVCALGAEILRKPGTPERQASQLQQLAAQSVRFETAVAMAQDGQILGEALVPTEVLFRALSSADITEYTRKEPAADCAGGFKVEGLGISLFEHVRSDDPTALVGLPLIATSALLRQVGLG